MFHPKVAVVFFFTLTFAILFSGIFCFIISVPLTALLLWIVSFFSYQQLPKERLHKFARVFNLAQDCNGDSGSSGSGTSDKVPLHRIILHRGGNVDVPENTLPAIQEAARQGVAGVEIDLQFTLDGVGILMHDDTLDRTTDATGDVRLKRFDELEGVNAAAKHKYGNGKPAVKIPTLEECLKECLRLNLLVFIDCKAFAQKTADLVDELFRKYPDLYDCAVVCSFYPTIIYCMRRKNPRVVTALTYRKNSLSCEVDCVTPRFVGFQQYLYMCVDFINWWITYAWTWRLCGNSFFLINKESLCRNEVNWWKDLGINLLIWTVNSDVEKQFCLEHLKVPIITDGL
ncbi:glycerophosphodiester phosphodiesterase 1-like [Babylonia areolata]|uniref:glycerophosphodiester phosphodiesterase 1-like n=1 Tax=Babylonia areolata TaxID=304850 RepID=UPI003FD0E571